jgi:hypothetical protein
LSKLLERLASLFPQAQMSQGFWWCLVAVSEGNRGNHLRVINGAGQACFESPQSMKRDFQAFKNRTAVNLLKSQAPIERKFAGGKRA